MRFKCENECEGMIKKLVSFGVIYKLIRFADKCNNSVYLGVEAPLKFPRAFFKHFGELKLVPSRLGFTSRHSAPFF